MTSQPQKKIWFKKLHPMVDGEYGIIKYGAQGIGRWCALDDGRICVLSYNAYKELGIAGDKEEAKKMIWKHARKYGAMLTGGSTAYQDNR